MPFPCETSIKIPISTRSPDHPAREEAKMSEIETPADRSLLIVDGLVRVDDSPPAYAVIDMKLADGSGLDVISRLKAKRPDARGIILTGYGNIATAVTA